MSEDIAIPKPVLKPAPEAAPVNRRGPELEGDYRPASGTYLDPVNARVEAADYNYLLQIGRASCRERV